MGREKNIGCGGGQIPSGFGEHEHERTEGGASEYRAQRRFIRPMYGGLVQPNWGRPCRIRRSDGQPMKKCGHGDIKPATEERKALAN
jgi:hypothetical protein